MNNEEDLSVFEKAIDYLYLHKECESTNFQYELIPLALDSGMRDIFEYQDNQPENQLIGVNKAVKRGYYKYWTDAIKYMHKYYNIEVQPYAYLLLLKTAAPPDTDMHSPDLVNKYQAIHAAIDEIATEVTKDLPHIDYLDDVSFLANNSDKQTNLLQEYFKIFHELKVFYQDKNRYTTKEERDKYDELMKIYRLLITE